MKVTIRLKNILFAILVIFLLIQGHDALGRFIDRWKSMGLIRATKDELGGYLIFCVVAGVVIGFLIIALRSLGNGGGHSDGG